ncbi:MAG: methylglyoxal synthase [Salaquimonas sp.]
MKKRNKDDIYRLALVAHDGMKPAMLKWARQNTKLLSMFKLFGTGTTGGMLKKQLGLKIKCLKSGPLGGDAQLGAMISEEKLDCLIFFIDPLSSQPHDVDVKSLTRLAVLYDTALALNEETADAILAHMERHKL